MQVRLSGNAPDVRELPHDVARDRAAENPARFGRGLPREGVELRTGDVGRRFVVRFHDIEEPGQVGDEAFLFRIATQRIGAAEIGLPIAEHRTEVEIDRVLGLDHAHRRLLMEGEDRVRAGAHDALVPVDLDPEVALGEDADVVVDLGLEPPRRHQPRALDRVEHRHPARLRGFEFCAAIGGHDGHLRKARRKQSPARGPGFRGMHGGSAIRQRAEPCRCGR